MITTQLVSRKRRRALFFASDARACVNAADTRPTRDHDNNNNCLNNNSNDDDFFFLFASPTSVNNREGA